MISSDLPVQNACGTAVVPFIATYANGIQFLVANSSTTSVSTPGTNYMPGGTVTISQLITGMSAVTTGGKPGVTLTIPSSIAGYSGVTIMDFIWEFSAIYTG